MRLLLDTHTLLWWWNGGGARLSARAVNLLQSPDHLIVVSAASAWELATKQRIGKLPELRQTVAEFFKLVERQRFELLSVTTAHALQAGGYATRHADPFDRLLAAQSELEDLPLVTRDPAFAGFPCKTLW